LYRDIEIYNQSITISDVLSPLNLTIIIPTSTYINYSNVSITSTQPSIVVPATVKPISSALHLKFSISIVFFLFVFLFHVK